MLSVGWNIIDGIHGMNPCGIHGINLFHMESMWNVGGQ